MRRSAVAAVVLLLLIACRSALWTPECPEPQYSKEEIVRLVDEELASRGLPPRSPRARVKIRRKNCDYLVYIIGVPKRPGDYLYLKLSPSGEILTFMPGL